MQIKDTDVHKLNHFYIPGHFTGSYGKLCATESGKIDFMRKWK